MNTVNLIGRIATKPELHTTETGTSVTSFQLAVPRDYVKQGAERETDFFTIVAWRKTAEFLCKHFVTGSRIGVTGKLRNRAFVNKTGENRRVVEIVADEFFFADGKETVKEPAQDVPTAEPTEEKAEPGSAFEEITDELPLDFG